MEKFSRIQKAWALYRQGSLAGAEQLTLQYIADLPCNTSPMRVIRWCSNPPTDKAQP